MNKVEQHLSTGEIIIHRSKINKTQYANLFFLLLLTVLAFSLGGYAWQLMLVITLCVLIYDALTINNTEFVITNKKVIHRKGIISTDINEILLQKIEGVKVNQTFQEKMFGAGTVIITGSGGTHTKLNNMNQPFEFRKVLSEAIEQKTNI